jgi:DNA-directed RNA polymerase specialized sigma subunit
MNNEEIDRYIRQNMALFNAIANKVKRNLPTFARNYDYDDIVQTVLEMSVARLKSYNKNKGSNIPNYLCTSAYFDTIRYIKNNFNLIRIPIYLIENATSFAKMSRLYNYSDKEIANRLHIPECRLKNISSVLNCAYEPLNEAFLTTYKDYNDNTDRVLDMDKLNRYIYKKTRIWAERDKNILKYLILGEGEETTKSLSIKYNTSYSFIQQKKRAIIEKLQKILLKYNPNIQEELLNG